MSEIEFLTYPVLLKRTEQMLPVPFFLIPFKRNAITFPAMAIPVQLMEWTCSQWKLMVYLI